MEPEQKSNGALVGLVVIIIILVLGGVYLWKNSMKERAKLENTNITSSNTDDSVDLNAEIDSLDLESLDSEI